MKHYYIVRNCTLALVLLCGCQTLCFSIRRSEESKVLLWTGRRDRGRAERCSDRAVREVGVSVLVSGAGGGRLARVIRVGALMHFLETPFSVSGLESLPLCL